MVDTPIQARSHIKVLDALPTKETSMCSLIIWNISKVVEKNPCIDLTFAMHSAHERLEREASDESRMIAQKPEDRHLTCALLAWQQLGYKDVDSLCQFIKNNRNNPIHTSKNSSNDENIGNVNKLDVSSKSMSSADRKRAKNIKNVESTSFDTYPLMGPVVKLPMDTKIVMRVENTSAPRHNAKKPQKTQNDVTSKIDAACCMDSACMQRLAELDKAVNDLRTRSAKLARREAERVELLERAEAAWKDLELGYQRRLSLAEEKEEDLAMQIQKTIEERNSYKNVCTTLAGALKERGDLAEKGQNRLKAIEKDVCDRACVRLRLSEESAKGDAALAEELCRGTQLERDLQFKEEQSRRKLLNLESEVDSSRCLTLEAERAMRFELSALKEQVTEVSKKLLTEDASNNKIRTELEQYRQEKANIIEDLDGCKVKCESRMQAKLDELNQKREQLKLLKEKVIECKCKLPLDVAVEVKRTPSLAALCRCTPEDKILETCSCTSLRSQLLSNLLSDLFAGLQAELGGSGVLMSCSLLLCLDDRHNWDRATAVKSNLRNFFSQLLVGELDIAIATSIEKYHAKWVGASCADQARMIPDPGEDENQGWQERAIERRAQKLATKLAEQLFEDRVDELTRKAKDVVSSGPPPCECKGQQPAIFPCIVKTPMTNCRRIAGDAPTSYIKRTLQDVNSLKTQIEELKKDSIKKEDLRLMEEKIARIIQRASAVNNSATSSRDAKSTKENNEINHTIKTGEQISENNSTGISVKRKEFVNSNLNKYVNKSPTGRIEKNTNKRFKKLEQSFAVNLCLCSGQEASSQFNPVIQRRDNLKRSWKQKKSKNLIANISSVKKIKPLHTITTKANNNPEESRFSAKTLCPNTCICFHKIPSNTSIDKLLEKLTNWNGSLNKFIEDTMFCNTRIEDGNRIKNISIKSEIVDLEKTKTLNDISPMSLNSTTLSSQLHNEVNNKSTICDNIVPFSTESEYIGTVNLDKSNCNICKCPINNNDNVKHGDGKSRSVRIPFHCINTNVCECKSVMDLNVEPQQRQLHTAPSIKKMSHVYSVNIPHSQFKCVETDTKSLNKNVSEKSIIMSGDHFIHDVVKKSQLFPHYCDNLVTFLGVTIANTNSPNKSVQVNTNKIQQLSSKVLSNQDDLFMNKIILKKNNKNIIPKSVSLENINENINPNKITCDVLDKKEDVCICCNHQELSKDLELNTFNLLEEHIKRKLSEFRRLSCKSFCIPPEEEEKIFGTILDKVKQVISENIKPFNSKCCNENTKDGSWARAYGLLQEYLKIKIKRIQCSRIFSEGNIESILPSILEKICDLIENDFQRLKEKCKCDNERQNNCDKLFLETENSIIIPSQRNKKFNESLFKDDKAKEQAITNQDVLLSHIGVNDKSCEVLNDVLKNLGKSQKTVSCEFGIYGTDCQCNTFTESYIKKDFILNQFTELISMKDNQIKTSTSLYEVCNTKNNSFATNHSMFFKEDGKQFKENDDEKKRKYVPEIQYIGCTLSCKSLNQTVTDKVDYVSTSLTYETCPKKCFDSNKVLTNVTSCNNIKTKDNSNWHFNTLPSIDKNRNNNRDFINNTEVNTFENKEDIVLKYSNEKFCKTSDNTRTFDESSVGTKDTNNEYLTDCHECRAQKQNDNYDPNTMFGKNSLYNSLNLPSAIEDFDRAHTSRNLFSTEVRFEESGKCDCNMVPICHVKMLVENIEKKLVHLQCTCDSLRSQACPVHSRGEFFFN